MLYIQNENKKGKHTFTNRKQQFRGLSRFCRIILDNNNNNNNNRLLAQAKKKKKYKYNHITKVI